MGQPFIILTKNVVSFRPYKSRIRKFQNSFSYDALTRVILAWRTVRRVGKESSEATLKIADGCRWGGRKDAFYEPSTPRSLVSTFAFIYRISSLVDEIRRIFGARQTAKFTRGRGGGGGGGGAGGRRRSGYFSQAPPRHPTPPLPHRRDEGGRTRWYSNYAPEGRVNTNISLSFRRAGSGVRVPRTPFSGGVPPAIYYSIYRIYLFDETRVSLASASPRPPVSATAASLSYHVRSSEAQRDITPTNIYRPSFRINETFLRDEAE